MIVEDARALFARLARLSLISLLTLSLLSPVASAQEGDDTTEDAPPPATRDREVDEVVVTGSRLKRDTYSSISPLQVITGQVSREIGSIDPSTILQESTASAGAQIDLTFVGLVLDNGPGAATLDLRGLGASRTLVLVNGRRLAPAGVEGAPANPDLNMIPSTLVERYETLLDGASSIYGSDAIAGVTNIILRKDFDGLEVEGYSSMPQENGGTSNTMSLAWGRAGDRGFFGIAGEYQENDPVTLDDRPWTAGCNTHQEIDENGRIRTLDLFYNDTYGMKQTPCKIGFGQRAWDNSGLFGSIYYTAGQTNTGIPSLSEATLWSVVVDTNQDGIPDVDFVDYNANGAVGHGHLLPDYDRASAMAYGEYTFAGEANITPYFEATWNERDVFIYNPGSILFQEVPANNPYNPCNPNGLNGVDCGLAYDSLLDDPGYRAGFRDYYVSNFNCFGVPAQFCTPNTFGLYNGASGPLPLESHVSIKGDRNGSTSKVSQTRIVAGIKGDMPFMSKGSFDNWTFDFAFVSSDSDGSSLRTGVNEVALLHSLNTSVMDPMTGAVTCGNGSDGCVPINLFAPSLFAGLIDNSFATQAEWDYLVSNRRFDTTYKQDTLTFLMTGDMFELQGGTVMGAIGFEMRNDEIDSDPNSVAADGELWGYFSDRGAVGDKDTDEAFVEVELPLLVNKPGIKELTVNFSTRYTKDEFYEGNWTYSSKLGYRPVDSLLIRGTVGTSYRAPNLRENFMLGQSGFRNSTFDPCVTPADAVTINGYDPSLDDREPEVLANCIAAGVDPTNLGVIASGATTPFYSVEVYGIGQLGLKEESSESWTAGFAFEQPWWQAFDMTIGATYYEIDVNDSIIRLHSQFSIDDCYNDLEGDSTFCQYLDRDLAGDGLIEFADEPFLNRDKLATRGVDLNVAVDWPTQMFGRAVDFGLDLSFNRKLGFQTVFVDQASGTEDKEEYVGEFGFPEWEGHGILRADIGKWRATWSTRYISSVEQDPLGIDPFDDIGGLSDTCLGPSQGDVLCRDVGYAENYFRHDVSVYYRGDVWTFGAGIRNLKNEWPPQVDSSEVASVYNNTPLGRGYDVNGRTVFLNVGASFQ